MDRLRGLELRGVMLWLTLTTAMSAAGIGEQQIFAELQAHNSLRSEALLEYSAIRTYQVADLKGKVHAEEKGRMEYRAPDQKTFTVTSEEGSSLVRRLALSPLIASEIKAASGKDHHDSAITPANYTLDLIGEADVGSYHCYVLNAAPKRTDKYLFAGKVWIDTEDYAVVRIEGHPAANLSFWIKRADFVREYQKVDGFWLPQKDTTVVQVRLYGKKVLTIDHRDYAVKGKPGANKTGAFANPLLCNHEDPCSELGLEHPKGLPVRYR
jgi:outer membrane lipoprotein-sorting protein